MHHHCQYTRRLEPEARHHSDESPFEELRRRVERLERTRAALTRFLEHAANGHPLKLSAMRAWETFLDVTPSAVSQDQGVPTSPKV